MNVKELIFDFRFLNETHSINARAVSEELDGFAVYFANENDACKAEKLEVSLDLVNLHLTCFRSGTDVRCFGGDN